ncbi:MAG: hypothetical protein AUJ85_05390 [Elusimicrobia bacterium CG1_02_37_114]|nr:MAG: hypothetical protein AUJ85_05390 [Elusimicrobia bacterium CG1_02_37_114]PIV52263.1 MAG: sugar ABC transporter permease [Elusimicrobia bacterium CG02_land_8_20_14_3_00_37_13]PIZ12627.1 MAG: sugar ABC transporter permease [Elusimicrobia bacterium CG_4_10_14_0_8_um_filter_37_32]
MKTKTRKNWQDIIAGYTFILPNFTGFLVFTSIPVIASLVLAFLSWDILTPAKFVGFNNFITLFKDKDFWYYLYNTVFFMLGIPLSMAFSLFLAILVNQKLKGITIFRTIFFLPVISSMVAIALVWRWIYNPDFGLLNSFLRYFLKQQPQWLSSTLWAKPALMFMGIWNGAGYSMLLYLAALQSIPEDLYEAARIDGASAWQQFRKITWPMLSFVNFFVIVMGVIGGFQAFGVQYVMTGGGPAGSTTTVVYYVYNNAFQWFKMGYASSIAWVLFIFIFGFTLLQWKYGKKAGEYY